MTNDTPADPADETFAHCDLPSPESDRSKSTRVSESMDIRIDTDRGRFVAEVKGGEAFIEYLRKGDGILHLVRTWVPPEARGGGVGALLAEFALDHVRAKGMKVTTSCWFVDKFIDESPRYQDLRAT